MAQSLRFKMIQYEPGGFKVPAKAKASGEYELDVEKGHETFHWDGTREKLGGSVAGWTHLTEPVTTPDGQSAVRVTMNYRPKPQVAAKRFVLLGTTKAELDGLLERMRPLLADRESQLEKVQSAKASGHWWAGIGKATVTSVKYGGRDGILKVVPDEGLQWSPGLGKTKIAFGAISKIEIGETSRRHGRQRSAIGFGGVGLAVVGATALHNHRAAKVDTYHVFAVTTKDGKQHQFITGKALSPLGPMYEAFRNAGSPAARPAQPEAQPSAPVLGAKAITEQRFELANYDGGLPPRPQPEAAGTLVFPGSGQNVGRWELHWATGQDLAIQHPITHGGIAHYPLSIEPMGPNSCRATIRDIQDPSIVGHFDLPNTAATLIEAALLARSHITEGGRRRLAAGGPSNTSPASQSPAPAPAQLGIADELTKLADLHEKGVLTDEEFAGHKARLLNS